MSLTLLFKEVSCLINDPGKKRKQDCLMGKALDPSDAAKAPGRLTRTRAETVSLQASSPLCLSASTRCRQQSDIAAWERRAKGAKAQSDDVRSFKGK